MEAGVLLDRVVDRGTFIAFVGALAAERERAARIEAANLDRYAVDGALDGKNATVDGFPRATLRHSPKRSPNVATNGQGLSGFRPLP